MRPFVRRISHDAIVEAGPITFEEVAALLMSVPMTPNPSLRSAVIICPSPAAGSQIFLTPKMRKYGVRAPVTHSGVWFPSDH
jgi:hypothetical protein